MQNLSSSFLGFMCPWWLKWLRVRWHGLFKVQFYCTLHGSVDVYPVYKKWGNTSLPIFLFHIESKDRKVNNTRSWQSYKAFFRFSHSWTFGNRFPTMFGDSDTWIYLRTSHFGCPENAFEVRWANLTANTFITQNQTHFHISCTTGKMTAKVAQQIFL